MPQKPSHSQCILLLCDTWSVITEGICGVNQSVALALSRYKGIQVYSTVIGHVDDLDPIQRSVAEKHGITLLGLAKDTGSEKEFYSRFNEDPAEFFAEVKGQIPFVSHIVGHSPITAEAALRLREQLYPESKVVLFYHVIPRDVEWLADRLPYPAPTDLDQVRMAEESDVVYSVTEKVHWYYAAKFRNRCQTEVDHRLFLPQCARPVFDVRRQDVAADTCDVITLTNESHACAPWSGVDVAACGLNKAASEMAKYENSTARPSLRIGGTDNDEQRVRDHVSQFVSELSLDVVNYRDPEELYRDLDRRTLCVVPSRSEPYGYMGLQALSAGIPTLIAEDSCLASVVKRLTSEPEAFLVPVTPSSDSVRQDGSVWRDRILGLLQNYQTAIDNAKQLQMALKRDEMTKETHDNVIAYVLGGIRVKHELTGLRFHYRKDEEKELPVTESFNRFLAALMKQCWRYKHHPLTTDSDLYPILPGIDLPIKELVSKVTDKIEERDRRIVGVDNASGSFIVYCPTTDALSDLWAMCDVINRSLSATLFSGDENPVLEFFKLESVTTRTIISGPEFLAYKNQLIKNMINEL